MSADNGIYIHKFRLGYACVHAQAIDNIYWKRGKRKYNYRILYEYFKGAKRFKTEAGAVIYASKLLDEMEKDGGYVEHGVMVV